jgi:hypothetical protein
MRLFIFFSFLLFILSCVRENCDDKKKNVENILRIKLPANCNCVSLYKTNYETDEYIGQYRYYINIKNCNSYQDLLISKLGLIHYSPSTLESNSPSIYNYKNLNGYSYKALWALNATQNLNGTIPKWWNPDTTLTNNYANYYIMGDSCLISPSKNDSRWNGKVVLQLNRENIFIYIETIRPKNKIENKTDSLSSDDNKSDSLFNMEIIEADKKFKISASQALELVKQIKEFRELIDYKYKDSTMFNQAYLEGIPNDSNPDWSINIRQYQPRLGISASLMYLLVNARNGNIRIWDIPKDTILTLDAWRKIKKQKK